MSRYLLNPVAHDDLDQIYGLHPRPLGYRPGRGLRARTAARLRPRAGRACEEIRAGYFRVPAGSHTVYYRLTTDGVVEIMRILHQRMDPDRHL
ncbi:type II toxin-antitoxin system RelE/ParE family toxin [Nocardia sp. NBC_00881]|uniref:type II toxin-antitoxin system RelE/ParE family toxin n=1 Tax=Nocardia sp. NBC_00881 TaxID=2975995 RepID=UPI00386ACB16